MALIAIQAVVDVAFDAAMFGIGLLLRMTVCTYEHGVIRGVGVAIAACGFVVRKPEPGVVESGSGPSGGGVAGSAGIREPGGDVVRIRSAVVDRLVAAIAIGWRACKFVVHVAARAGHRGVCAG